MPLTLKGSTSGGVTIDVPAIAGNNTLTFPAATGTALIGTTTTANQVFFGGATSGTLSQDSSLFWDNTNKRLGVGTANPSAILDIFDGSGGVKLQIKRDANAIFQIYQGGSITYLDAATAGGTFSFLVNAQEKMRLDAFGNLGLGVTPSAVSGRMFEISAVGHGLAYRGLADIAVTQNAYWQSGSWKYGVTTGVATSAYHQTDGSHRWLNAPSGTAGDPITFTQAMTLSANGALGIGVGATGAGSTYGEKLLIAGAGGTQASIMFWNAGQGSGQIGVPASGSNLKIYNTYSTGTLAGGVGIDIDQNGKVGIGTASSLTSKLNVSGGDINCADETAGRCIGFSLYNKFTSPSGVSTAYYGLTWGPSESASLGLSSFNSIVFYTQAQERARINASGNLLVGNTSFSGTQAALMVANGSSVNGNAARLGLFYVGGQSNGSDYPAIGYNMGFTSTTTINYATTDTASMIRFSAGKIETFTAPNGTLGTAITFTQGPYVAQGGTTWTNGSDERLKDIIEPITNAVTKVSTLRSIIGKFKTDPEDKRRVFLMAQDVQKVLPEAVDVSNPDSLGLNYTDVIPLLVASIKELAAEVAELKAKVA